MKSALNFLLLIFGLLLANIAHAESPREQLQQMVEQLQQTPSDTALRERIIKLATTLKPSLAVPDAAIAFEGRARFAFDHAKSEEDYLAAAREYEKAAAAAPWLPNTYFNLCVTYEKAGKFADAKRNCEIYLIGLTDPAEISNVKGRIAGLEFGIEKVNKENSPEARATREAAKEKEAEQRFIASLEGAKYICRDWKTSFYADNSTDEIRRVEISIVNGIIHGETVTTWISPRRIRDHEPGDSVYVGYRGDWSPDIPFRGRINVTRTSWNEMRVEIDDGRLVYQKRITHTGGTDVLPAETCTRTK